VAEVGKQHDGAFAAWRAAGGGWWRPSATGPGWASCAPPSRMLAAAPAAFVGIAWGGILISPVQDHPAAGEPGDVRSNLLPTMPPDPARNGAVIPDSQAARRAVCTQEAGRGPSCRGRSVAGL